MKSNKLYVENILYIEKLLKEILFTTYFINNKIKFINIKINMNWQV